MSGTLPHQVPCRASVSLKFAKDMAGAGIGAAGFADGRIQAALALIEKTQEQ